MVKCSSRFDITVEYVSTEELVCARRVEATMKDTKIDQVPSL